jgi:hypothetical protein
MLAKYSLKVFHLAKRREIQMELSSNCLDQSLTIRVEPNFQILTRQKTMKKEK